MTQLYGVVSVGLHFPYLQPLHEHAGIGEPRGLVVEAAEVEVVDFASTFQTPF